jgi:tRNA modification GTPase
MSAEDTIFAMASGSGRAAVAVMRLSGPGTEQALRAITGGGLPPPRRASLRRLADPSGAVLDQALVLWMPGPASYTGEDSAELHLHAGPAVLDGVAAALVTQGLRPAEAGEFTRRAFLNGRMALTEAEAVADLIAAETEAQRRQALQQLGGSLGRVFDDWALRLRHLLAEQEALIDFPDESDGADRGAGPVLALIGEIEAQLADERRGERLRAGLCIAISGAPNVGKSSLVNALARRDAAIVSSIPGTTRDVIEVRGIFGGVPVTLLDTAGLRDSIDPVEAEGVRRARARASEADLVLLLSEAGSGAPPSSEGALQVATSAIHIGTKIDLAPAPAGTLGVSVVTGAGLGALRDRLDQEARRLTQQAGPPPLTQARHRAACLDAVHHLRGAAGAPAAELRAEELRLAMRALGRVTGRVGVEDVLDSVFSQFCIGK